MDRGEVNMNNMMDKRSANQFGVFASGLALGGIIGAGIALLLAPDSGEHTRSVIGDRSNDLVNQLGGKVNEVRNNAQQQLDAMRQSQAKNSR